MHSDEWEAPQYKRLMQKLLGVLKGEVIEIGPGPGVNLKYYRDKVRWTGIEPPERLLLLSRAARWCPLDSPFSLAPIHRSAWKEYSANLTQTAFSEVRMQDFHLGRLSGPVLSALLQQVDPPVVICRPRG